MTIIDVILSITLTIITIAIALVGSFIVLALVGLMLYANPFLALLVLAVVLL